MTGPAMTGKVHLDHAHVRDLLTGMLRIRRFEEKCFELYQSEKIRGFMHLYDGEEAVSVGVIAALLPQDAVVATYREHGQALARIPCSTRNSIVPRRRSRPGVSGIRSGSCRHGWSRPG
jgi:TPP-dependent pyruvate/acetoin dehydrogenase alpha subunit